MSAVEDRRDRIYSLCEEMRKAGMPDDALSPVEEYAGTLVCEGCDRAATDGPFGSDSVYLCEVCSALDSAEAQA